MTTQVERAQQPAEVDLAREIVDQEVASLQARASMRALDVQLDVLGSIIDIKA